VNSAIGENFDLLLRLKQQQRQCTKSRGADMVLWMRQ